MTVQRVQVRFGRGAGPALGAVSPAVRFLIMAHAVDRRLRAGTLADYGEAAEWLGVTPDRASKIGRLVLLSPVIQAALLDGRCGASASQLLGVSWVAGWEGQERLKGQR